MTVVGVAFLTSAYIAVAGDPKTGLPDKAIGIITAIVAGRVGYITGKGSKPLPRFQPGSPSRHFRTISTVSTPSPNRPPTLRRRLASRDEHSQRLSA
jgi:hypothetical protein